MCDFISYLIPTTGKKKTPYYISNREVGTEKFKEVEKYSGSSDDILGHYFCRKYYELDSTKFEEREVNCFDKPHLLPEEIVYDIKHGNFSDLPISIDTLKALVEGILIGQVKKGVIRRIHIAEGQIMGSSQIISDTSIKKDRQRSLLKGYEKLVLKTIRNHCWCVIRSACNRNKKWR